jgi:hypothetical protein
MPPATLQRAGSSSGNVLGRAQGPQARRRGDGQMPKQPDFNWSAAPATAPACTKPTLEATPSASSRMGATEAFSPAAALSSVVAWMRPASAAPTSCAPTSASAVAAADYGGARPEALSFATPYTTTTAAMDSASGTALPPKSPRSFLRGTKPLSERIKTGQGPFKHSQSVERALFGVEQTETEMKLALGRIDPDAADIDGQTRGNDRALMAGLAVLLDAAERAEIDSKRHHQQFSKQSASVARERVNITTEMDGRIRKDPRLEMRDTLFSTSKMARAVHSGACCALTSVCHHQTHALALTLVHPIRDGRKVMLLTSRPNDRMCPTIAVQTCCNIMTSSVAMRLDSMSASPTSTTSTRFSSAQSTRRRPLEKALVARQRLPRLHRGARCRRPFRLQNSVGRSSN